LDRPDEIGFSPTADTLEEIGNVFLLAAASGYPASIETAASAIVDAFAAHRKLLVFGNGGSAADAQHLCGEIVVRFRSNRQALPAVALSSDAAVMTACGNDFSFERIFARQIEALGTPGDVALGISTSGSSPNIVAAMKTARERALTTILLTGPSYGRARDYSDWVLAAPGANTARIQELHLATYHIICETIDARFSRRAE
jgi:D-sedoheptulose 7-phosphate isomerase